jgi:hypothetical protein
MNGFSCHILPIIHVYNIGISWLWSYVRLYLEDVTLSYAQLQSEGATLVVCTTLIVCPTPVGRHGSDHMSDSGQKTWLWSYARLRSKDTTLAVCLISVGRYDFNRISRLQSHFLTPSVDVTTWVISLDVGRWACHMSYQLICERLRMVELDDCNILQLKHLVGSNFSRVHDLFRVQNLNI